MDSFGFFHWRKGKRAEVNEQCALEIRRIQEANCPGKIRLPSKLIAGGVVLPVISEALHFATDENISPHQVDLLCVLGHAKFPSFLGGPIRYAETVKLHNILSSMRELKKEGLINGVPSVLSQLDTNRLSFYPGWPCSEGVSPNVVLPAMRRMSTQELLAFFSFVVIFLSLAVSFIYSKL